MSTPTPRPTRERADEALHATSMGLAMQGDTAVLAAEVCALREELEAARAPRPDEVVHLCPTGDADLTPCCGRSVMEMSLARVRERIMTDPELATCPGRSGEQPTAVPQPKDVAPYEMDETERLALPARYHRPAFVGVGRPQVWCCAVCWGDGWTASWPCEVVARGDGAVEVAKTLGVDWST